MAIRELPVTLTLNAFPSLPFPTILFSQWRFNEMTNLSWWFPCWRMVPTIPILFAVLPILRLFHTFAFARKGGWINKFAANVYLTLFRSVHYASGAIRARSWGEWKKKCFRFYLSSCTKRHTACLCSLQVYSVFITETYYVKTSRQNLIILMFRKFLDCVKPFWFWGHLLIHLRVSNQL